MIFLPRIAFINSLFHGTVETAIFGVVTTSAPLSNCV